MIKIIQILTINININRVKLKQLKVNETTCILEVHVNSSLDWNDQYKVIKEKLEHSITKLMRIPINEFQVHIYFYVYIVKSIYFGVRIAELSIK